MLGNLFQDLNHFQPERAVSARPPAGGAAVDKVFDFDQQGFDIAEIGSHHVAESIGELVLSERFGLLHHYATVIDLYLFAGVGIVIHDHALGADDRRAAHLLRRKPTDFDGCHHAAGELEPDERHIILVLLHTGTPEGTSPDGHFVKPMQQDRHIVDGQIPDDINIFLVQAQIHARQADVMDVSQRPILNEVLHHVYGWAVNKGMAGHERASLALRQFDEFFGKARAVGKWFFDHHMLAAEQSFAGEFEMGGDWGCNHYRVHAVPELVRRRESLQRRIRAYCLPKAPRVGIAASDEFTFLRLVQGPREIGPPVAVADQSDSHIYPAFARELRRACSFFAFDTTTASRNCD